MPRVRQGARLARRTKGLTGPASPNGHGKHGEAPPNGHGKHEELTPAQRTGSTRNQPEGTRKARGTVPSSRVPPSSRVRCDARRAFSSRVSAVGASHVHTSLIELSARGAGGSLVSRPSLVPRPEQWAVRNCVRRRDPSHIPSSLRPVTRGTCPASLVHRLQPTVPACSDLLPSSSPWRLPRVSVFTARRSRPRPTRLSPLIPSGSSRSTRPRNTRRSPS